MSESETTIESGATPAVGLLVEIMNAAAALANSTPAVVALLAEAIGILRSGTVSAEKAASIRAQLDATKALIDAG